MQEIKKRRIVIASVLKPVDDTRMFEKIGLSLAKFYNVHILGYPAVIPETTTNVSLRPHKSFARISLTRVWTPCRIFAQLLRIKPDMLIITTHELLWIAIVFRLFTGSKIVYDVQENYYRNIAHTRAFPPLLRNVVAAYVRIKEIIAMPFIGHYFLAEQCYTHELPFARSRATVLENKFKPPQDFAPRTAKRNGLHLFFSGTLAESTGIFPAIALTKNLHQRNPAIRLTIIGYCAQPTVLDRIKEEIRHCPFIRLTGGDKLVPHAAILDAIGESDFGIISYPPNRSTENCIPTKLYEYLACRLPMLVTDHALWTSLCEPYAAAIAVNFQESDAVSILEQMTQRDFYTREPQHVFWNEEEDRLLACVHKIIGAE